MATNSNIQGLDYPTESDPPQSLWQKLRNTLRVLDGHDHSKGKGAPLSASSLPAGPSVPISGIIDFPSNNIPDNFVILTNQVVARSEYSELFAVLGTAWNQGTETADQFRLPPGAGYVYVGAGIQSGLTTRTLGTTGGEETHALLTAELASHTHTIAHTHSFSGSGTSGNESVSGSHTHPAPHGGFFDSDAGGGFSAVSGGSIIFSLDSNTGASGPPSHQHTTTISGTTGGSSGADSGSQGSGTAHNNMQPFAVMNKIIRVR